MKGRPGLMLQGLVDLLPTVDSPESSAVLFRLLRAAALFELWLERELKISDGK